MALPNTPRPNALAQHALEQALEAAHAYAGKSRAAATWRAYQNDWRQFEAWCHTVAQRSLPATADVVALFVAAQAAEGRSPATLSRRLAAIRLVHLGAGHASPHNALAVAEVMRGIRRDWGKCHRTLETDPFRTKLLTHLCCNEADLVGGRPNADEGRGDGDRDFVSTGDGRSGDRP